MDRARRYFEFDGFRLIPDERALTRNGEPVPLAPKVFDVLVALVENNRHTVSKTDLFDRVWSDSIVEENSLNRNVSILRRALGGSDGNGSYIKTVPKTGYRFEADVRCIVEDEEELVLEKRTNYKLTFRSEVSIARSSFKRRSLVVGATAAVIAIGAVAGLAYWNRWEALKTRKAEAFELYHRGRALWQNRSPAGLHEATLLLEKAVALDPESAMAHAALADAYAFDVRNSKKAEGTARRAIKLNPNLGQPHATIGFVRLFWEWNPAEAEDQFKQSIELDPEYATAHQWYAAMLASVGHFNESIVEIGRAAELEPDSPAIKSDMCQLLYFASRYFESEAYCKEALELDPQFFNAHSNLYSSYVAMGKYREALESYFARERLAVNASSLPADFEQMRIAFGRGGIEEFWREQIRLRKRSDDDCGVTLAWAHAKLGEKDEATTCLERAAHRGEFDLIFIYADPVFRRLGDHPRYSDIANRLMKSELSRTGR